MRNSVSWLGETKHKWTKRSIAAQKQFKLWLDQLLVKHAVKVSVDLSNLYLYPLCGNVSACRIVRKQNIGIGRACATTTFADIFVKWKCESCCMWLRDHEGLWLETRTSGKLHISFLNCFKPI